MNMMAWDKTRLVAALQALERRGLTYMPSAFSLKETFQVPVIYLPFVKFRVATSC